MQYKWPLQVSNFTLWDKLDICKFILLSDRWTQGKYVKLFEQKMASYVDCKYAVFVSSGSTANQLICQKIKDDLIKNKEWPKRNQVIVNSVTWATNINCWIREGFEPVFIDISLDDFCIDKKKLSDYLYKNHKKVACIFPTSVLGYAPDIPFYQLEAQSYNIKLAIDNCESTSSKYYHNHYGGRWWNLSSEHTSSTSTFWAHFITSCEGGFVFTNNKKEYEYYLMARAHGLIRNLQAYNEHFPPENMDSFHGYDELYNPLVNSQFDFNIVSGNYRNTDIGAFIGLLDFERIEEYEAKRLKLYNIFYHNLDKLRYYLPQIREKREDIPFCLPIICRGEKSEERLRKVKNRLEQLKIEYRPFISGNCLRQVIYQKYGNYKDFPNAELINNNAIYVGLWPKLKEEQVLSLTSELNKL